MLTDEDKMQLITKAAEGDYKGSFGELFAQADPQSQMQVASSPQEQAQGLRGAPQGTSMAFPESSGDFNTQGMDYPIDIQKFDAKGDLVRSYENVPPGVNRLPMGEDVGTVVETPAEYQDGGFKAWMENLPDNLKNTNSEDYNLEGAHEAGLEPTWNEQDQSYHLGSRNPQTGEILKSQWHDTFDKALNEDEKLGYKSYLDEQSGKVYTHKLGSNLPKNRTPFNLLPSVDVVSKRRKGGMRFQFQTGGLPVPSLQQEELDRIQAFKKQNTQDTTPRTDNADFNFDPYADLASQSDQTAVNTFIPTTQDLQAEKDAAEIESQKAISNTGTITQGRTEQEQNIIDMASNSFGASQTGGGTQGTRQTLTEAAKQGKLNEAVSNFTNYSGVNIAQMAAPIGGGGGTAAVKGAQVGVNLAKTYTPKAVSLLKTYGPQNLGAWVNLPNALRGSKDFATAAQRTGRYFNPIKGKGLWGNLKGAAGELAYTAHAPFIAGMPGLVDFKDSYISKTYEKAKKGDYKGALLAGSEIFGPKGKAAKFGIGAYKTVDDFIKGDDLSGFLRFGSLFTDKIGTGPMKSISQIMTGFRKARKLDKAVENQNVNKKGGFNKKFKW
jgi:hypothetical protein